MGVAASKQPRPFLFLEPRELLEGAGPDPVGLRALHEICEECLPLLVRSLVNHTIARSNEVALRPQPIAMTVLNRRRRAARSWLLAIVNGAVDAATSYQVAEQWLPLLCGTGPDRTHWIGAAQRLVEFVRGAITACIFDAPTENLLTQARALHVMETILAHQLAWIERAVDRRAVPAESLA